MKELWSELGDYCTRAGDSARGILCRIWMYSSVITYNILNNMRIDATFLFLLAVKIYLFSTEHFMSFVVILNT